MHSHEEFYLSVIIPAYNEEQRLPLTLAAVLEYLRRQSYSWEVIVVNDGSTDTTAAIVKATAEHEPTVRLLEYGHNRGKGYAVRFGMIHARGEWRLFMDADNSTALNQIESFWPLLKEGYDVVIGSRDVPGAEIAVHQSWWKELLGDLGNLWIRFWAVPGIHDTQAGFKIFSRKAAEMIFPYLTIAGWAFDVEALAVARMRGFRVKEMPIRWSNDPHSKVKAKAYFTVLKEVVRTRINKMRGVYAIV